jgi:hypothetical protein
VRLRDIGEARVLLQASDLDASEVRVAETAQARRSRGALLVAGGAVLGALIGAFALNGDESESPGELATSATSPPPVRRFSQPPGLDDGRIVFGSVGEAGVRL